MERFRSEISVGLLAIPALALTAVPIAMLSVVPAEQRARALLTMAVVLIPIGALIVWLFATTEYRVEGNHLLIRSGPFKWQIDLTTVRRLRATHSLLSAPALSLNRIEVEYGRSTVLVSPADRRGFIRAVVARTPNVVIEGLDADR